MHRLGIECPTHSLQNTFRRGHKQLMEITMKSFTHEVITELKCSYQLHLSHRHDSISLFWPSMETHVWTESWHYLLLHRRERISAELMIHVLDGWGLDGWGLEHEQVAVVEKNKCRWHHAGCRSHPTQSFLTWRVDYSLTSPLLFSRTPISKTEYHADSVGIFHTFATTQAFQFTHFNRSHHSLRELYSVLLSYTKQIQNKSMRGYWTIVILQHWGTLLNLTRKYLPEGCQEITIT